MSDAAGSFLALLTVSATVRGSYSVPGKHATIERTERSDVGVGELVLSSSLTSDGVVQTIEQTLLVVNRNNLNRRNSR